MSLLASKAPVSLPLGFSAEEFDPGDEETGQEPTAEDDKATAAKKVAPLIASKKV
jgi:RNA-binding protein 5/10